MAEPRRFQRYFAINTNTSIAASTKETVIDLDFKGIIRQINVMLSGDDSTGTTTLLTTMTADGNIIFSRTAAEVNQFFSPQAGFHQTEVWTMPTIGKIQEQIYDSSIKYYVFTAVLDTEISENFLVEVTNTDATNVLVARVGIVYDKEI